jgi:hypothetical protein
MAILFTKPTKAAKRLKLMLYGVAGVGKTTAAIQFPNPAIIDTERGAENDTYVDLINAKGGAILSTSSFDTIMEQVKALATTEHPYRTLVIDPITVVYDAMATAWEKRVGDEWSRHRAKAVTDWKRLTNLLAALDMNVVFTSHAKSEWVNGESTGRFTFDGPKGADYWMDLVIEVQRSGEERFGIIRKSRIKTLPVDETFPFSYDELADRYGRDVLERDSKPVASQYLELMDLIESREDGEDIASRILKKKGVATLSELSLDDIQKAIEWLTNG